MSEDRQRCWWAEGDTLLRAYHDDEWGRPVSAERHLFEMLALEGFQAGLSWLTILRKRDGFRAAFAGFDPAVVAGFDEADRARLMADAGIVRNRAKIEATIANARATLGLRDGPHDLAQLVWSFRPERPVGHPVPAALRDMPAHVPESAALAKRLKKGGFRFLGPTTLYAGMQACGLVNDHLESCAARGPAAAAQAAAVIP
jgi:DNA-3-methyladenine glycosylase I